MLNNCSRGDPTDICIGEIGRYLLVLSDALGNGKRLLSSGQIVDDLKTRLGELSKRFKSPQIPVDTRDAMNRYLSQVKKDLALFDDHEVSPKDLAEKYEWSGKRMYDFLFSHVPPTDFPGISCELQNLKVLVEAYNPSSPLVTLLATWMASSMTLLAQNHNDILSAQEHSHIHIYAVAATKFLDNIGSSSQTECLKRLDETIQFFRVQEEYANVNRPTSQSLDALEEFNFFVDELCGCIVNSLYRSDDWPWSYSLDEIMSLSKGVGETLYSGQSLFCDKNKHEVEQAFRKSVEILADATKSEFWDDFADLTKALCVLGEYSETLREAELSLCRLSPGRVALADRGGSGTSPLDSDARKKDDNPDPAAGEDDNTQGSTRTPKARGGKAPDPDSAHHVDMNRFSRTPCDKLLVALFNEYQARGEEPTGVTQEKFGKRSIITLRRKLQKHGHEEVAQANKWTRVKDKKTNQWKNLYYIGFERGQFSLSFPEKNSHT